MEGANDLLRLVETKIVDDTLVIRFKDGVRLDPLPSIEVHTTHLVALESRGDGDLRLQGVVPSCTRGQVLELTLKGSGDVRGDGSLERLSIQHLGSGDVDLRALNAETIDYAGYGSGDARLCASEALESNTYGCGDLFIYGTVPDERMKVSPVGSSMKRMD